MLVRPFETLCVGASYHATFCFPCGVCCGCVLGHLIVTLQVHLHSHDYIVVVTCCNYSFSSLVRLSCIHRSCGEPRPTSPYKVWSVKFYCTPCKLAIVATNCVVATCEKTIVVTTTCEDTTAMEGKVQ